MTETINPLPRLIELGSFSDGRGELTFVEYPRHISFPIKRVYYLYNVSNNSDRGFHAHRQLHQILIALNGSFRANLDNGIRHFKFTLDRPDQGLYVGPMTWRELTNFSPGAICLVLASLPYDESDYIRNYADFLEFVSRVER